MAETTWIEGMAARDPETGVRWRLAAIDLSQPHLSTRLFAREGGNTLWTLAITDDGRRFGGGTATMRNELTRALAAGPDLTDLTTALVVACQNGWELFRSQGRDGGICCKYMTPWGVRVVWGKDGADAVLKAAQDKYSEAVQSAAKAERGVTCIGCELADDCPGFADCPKLAAAKAEGER